ncbi:MAG: DEAD/DEAH box helicase family protein [Syntrophomonadaceae bacterium]|nr:DEAD/DEAH box helicase family protein [Syntrophomonadaceae bacterium]
MLNERLVLFHFMLDQFGFQNLRELKAYFFMRELADDEPQSQFCRELLSRAGLKVTPEALRQYDENIIACLKAINAHRGQSIRLKYYQYFTVLFVEYYLDRYFNDRYSFLDELNQFMTLFENHYHISFNHNGRYTLDALNKLAIWQATGAGKTFMLHFNILQYRRYCSDINNVLVLTPSESMSEQHLQELRDSGIEAELYLNRRNGEQVKIIDINKVREVKKGQGVTVTVAEFGQKNLLLVDEGHKGSASEERIQRNLRESLAQYGFTFEYSATFGQVSGEDLQCEYAKCIIFDYSYHYFWNDGYGKDYWIHNISEKMALDEEAARRSYLLLNLTLFAQQKLFYERHLELMQEYQIETPLLIFVGHTVNEKSKSQSELRDNERTLSDVRMLVEFIKEFLQDSLVYLKLLEQIYQGDYPFADEYDSQLSYIKSECANGLDLYNAILRLVFHSDLPGGLELCDIAGASGEIGLRTQNSDHFFGLIYIGDTARFKNSLAGDYTIKTERIRQPLFASLSQPLPNPVNILIGARMFTEGWNNYRVSSIGLINFGRAEGSQVIQLFGRGVRLHGRDNSLKRSQGSPVPGIRIVETLNIFGLNADYMARFQQEMIKEHMLLRKSIFKVPIKRREDMESLELYGLERKADAPEFKVSRFLNLEQDNSIKVVLDLSTRRMAFSSQANNELLPVNGGKVFKIPDDWLRMINWSRVYLRLQEYKKRKQLLNLTIPRVGLDRFFIQINKEIVLDDDLQLEELKDIKQMEQLSAALLNRYIQQYYDARKNEYEGLLLDTAPLTGNNPNFQYQHYEMELIASDEEGNLDAEINLLLNQVGKLLNAADCPENLANGRKKVRAVRFDVKPRLHLYQPLLFDAAEQTYLLSPSVQNLICSLKPLGLNKSEAFFVEDLQGFVSQYAGELYPGAEFYLLRNLSKTGTGFYFSSAGGFFPDFILWIKQQRKQYMTFFDPHGLHNEQARFNSKRISLHQDIKILKLSQPDLILNSFILVPGSLLNFRPWLEADSDDLYPFFNARNVYEIRQQPGSMGNMEYISEIIKRIMS